jgi:hypothetical protein
MTIMSAKFNSPCQAAFAVDGQLCVGVKAGDEIIYQIDPIRRRRSIGHLACRAAEYRREFLDIVNPFVATGREEEFRDRLKAKWLERQQPLYDGPPFVNS